MLIFQIMYDSTLKSSTYQEVMRPLIEDVSSVVENGVSYKGKIFPVRLAALQGDGLERASMSGMCATFSAVSFFDPLSYVSTKTRINCKKVEDLATEVEDRRTPDTYEDDLLSLRRRERQEAAMKTAGTLAKSKAKLKPKHYYSRGLKFASPWNEVPYYHVVARGSLIYCISHDLYSGIFRTDMARIMLSLANHNCYSWTDLQSKFRRKRLDLKGDDRQGWYDIIAPKPQFKQLPGNHGCNHLIIRFFSTLFISRPPNSKLFKTTAWELYLVLKRIAELVSAKIVSDRNKDELSSRIKEYLKVTKETFHYLFIDMSHIYVRLKFRTFLYFYFFSLSPYRLRSSSGTKTKGKSFWDHHLLQNLCSCYTTLT